MHWILDVRSSDVFSISICGGASVLEWETLAANEAWHWIEEWLGPHSMPTTQEAFGEQALHAVGSPEFSAQGSSEEGLSGCSLSAASLEVGSQVKWQPSDGVHHLA